VVTTRGVLVAGGARCVVRRVKEDFVIVGRVAGAVLVVDGRTLATTKSAVLGWVVVGILVVDLVDVVDDVDVGVVTTLTTGIAVVDVASAVEDVDVEVLVVVGLATAGALREGSTKSRSNILSLTPSCHKQ